MLAQYAAEHAEGGGGSGEGVTYERVAPCLLPEKQQVMTAQTEIVAHESFGKQDVQSGQHGLHPLAG